MKYVFGTDPGTEIRYLDKSEGEITTASDATVFYRFDRGDKSVKLNIDGEWFWEKDIDQAIEFLQAVKAELKATGV